MLVRLEYKKLDIIKNFCYNIIIKIEKENVMDFSQIKNNNTNFITVNTKEIGIDDNFKVKLYLPIKDKYDIIDIVLQNSQEDVVFNPIKMDMYFNTYLVFSYTDIEFSDEEKIDIEDTYNRLSQSGLLDLVLKNIPEGEYQYLYDNLVALAKDRTQFNSTISAMIQSLINNLPEQAEAVENIIKNFDEEKFQKVIDFATAANGNRNIENNQPVE